MSNRLPMVEEAPLPVMRIERLQEAVRAAYDILAYDVSLDDILAERDRASGREPIPGKGEILLERLRVSVSMLASKPIADAYMEIMAAAIAPKNKPKRSAAELAALAYPAELTGNKSKYGGGFDERRGDDVSDLFPAT